MFYFKCMNPFDYDVFITDARVVFNNGTEFNATEIHYLSKIENDALQFTSNSAQYFSIIPYNKTLLIVSPVKIDIRYLIVNGVIQATNNLDLDEALQHNIEYGVYIGSSLDEKMTVPTEVEFNGLW